MEKIDIELFEKLKQIAERFIALKKKVANANNLSLGEVAALCVVYNYGPIIQTKIGELSGLDKPATSRLINRMVGLGLINKNYKDNNKKNTFINLTLQGKDLIEKVYFEMSELKMEFFKMLSDEDKKIAMDLMDKVLM